CGKIPPHPPTANVDQNMDEAGDHWNPWWFKGQVQNFAPWDYKRQDLKYDDFGNFNYGAAGYEFGFSETRLLREAGRAQNAREKGDPGWLLNTSGGAPPYGDDEQGQTYIKAALAYAKCMDGRNCPGGGKK